jgi:very-short-patch-repair endonuclease
MDSSGTPPAVIDYLPRHTTSQFGDLPVAVHVERVHQALSSIKPPAVASHRSAAALWGFGPIPDDVDVLIPHRRKPRPRSGIAIHRSLDFDIRDFSSLSGLPVTNPLRTLVDLGAVAPEAVEPAVASTAISRLVVPSAARAELDRRSVGGRPGLGPLRAALDDWPLGDEAPNSELEILVAKMLRRHRIYGFEFHRLIAGFEVDFANSARRTVLECDGWEFHSSRTAFESDRHRDVVLAAHGWLVLRVTWWQVVEEQAATAELIKSAVDHRFRPPSKSATSR